MAIDDLPLPVVNLLNVIGVAWPYVDEQTINQLAAFTRQFGEAVQTTHDDAGRQVSGIADAYKSSSSEQMTDGWAKLSARHVQEITEGCAVLATALNGAADYVIAAKAAAVAQLVTLAAEVGGDIVAGVFTLGLADTVLPEIEAAADKVVQSLIMDLEQAIIAKVITAALKPLMAKVEDALAGLDWSQSSADAAGKGVGLELDAPAARAHVQALATYASDMRSHAFRFSSQISGLSF